MSGFDAGRVTVRLTVAGPVVAGVTVSCTRPDVAATLAGRPADEAVRLVPLIYSLCGQAQGIAARLALAAARGEVTTPYVDARVAAEAMREHAWKLLVDWPRALGLTGDEALFVRVARTTPGAGSGLAAELRASPVFAAACDGLLAERIAARGEELVALLEGRPTPAGAVAAAVLAPGWGRATVMTARGELRHEIRLAGERIAAYDIEAPTDRLFAPDGTVARSLAEKVGAGDTAPEAFGVWARRIVLAYDPCVPWELELADA